MHLPEGYALQHTNDPESLREDLRRQYQSKGLTIMSDQVYAFFKVLFCKVKTLQTFQQLEQNMKHLLSITEMHLKSDVQVLDLWLNLFIQPQEFCNCSDNACESLNEYDTDDEQNRF